ncbi:MAG: cytochrome c1 [Rhodospirillaceae bacterium]|nr:cytochrome c1 [Rhodospirillaceae bacterium]
MRVTLAAAVALAALAGAPAAKAAGEGEPLKQLSLSSDGVFGTFDRKQLQRGLSVYVNVCASCHGLKLVAYRNLVDIGLTPSEAKAVAAKKKVTEIGDDGQPKERPADLKDKFVSPFANPEAAAAANGGKEPPDLSLIVKAREGNASYIYSLLTGYSEPPKDWKDEEGKPKKLEGAQQYNKYFPGHVIAMPPPLTTEDQAPYPKDGPKATVDQMAKDVSAFLTWAAEPKMEERKRTGIKVMLFLLFFTGVFFVVKRRVWRSVH